MVTQFQRSQGNFFIQNPGDFRESSQEEAESVHLLFILQDEARLTYAYSGEEESSRIRWYEDIDSCVAYLTRATGLKPEIAFRYVLLHTKLSDPWQEESGMIWGTGKYGLWPYDPTPDIIFPVADKDLYDRINRPGILTELKQTAFTMAAWFENVKSIYLYWDYSGSMEHEPAVSNADWLSFRDWLAVRYPSALIEMINFYDERWVATIEATAKLVYNI